MVVKSVLLPVLSIIQYYLSILYILKSYYPTNLNSHHRHHQVDGRQACKSGRQACNKSYNWDSKQRHENVHKLSWDTSLVLLFSEQALLKSYLRLNSNLIRIGHFKSSNSNNSLTKPVLKKARLEKCPHWVCGRFHAFVSFFCFESQLLRGGCDSICVPSHYWWWWVAQGWDSMI